MCDLIRRQDAIDAHYEYCNKHPDAWFPVWSLKILENLPSAQPKKRTEERTETHACDLIDRQAAIDALDKHLQTTDVPVSYPGIISALTEWLNELPSAQPDLDEVYAHAETEAEARYHAERKKGRWIPQDHNKTNGMMSTLVYYYPKCSVCGHCANYTNFCPNCGADMRIPVETARDIVHEAINNSVWSDTVDTAEMHMAVDDKYTEVTRNKQCLNT